MLLYSLEMEFKIPRLKIHPKDKLFAGLPFFRINNYAIVLCRCKRKDKTYE